MLQSTPPAPARAARDYSRGEPMGLNSLLRVFLPHDDKFLTYIEQAADNIRDAAAIYSSLSRAASREDMTRVREEIKNLEHVGDKLTHTIFEELNRSFITPFDREDVYSLTKSMDDVLDVMDHVSDLLVLYHIDRLEDGMSMMLDVTRRAIADIHKSVHSLRKMNYEVVRDQIVSVHALENEGDRLYRHFVGKLYEEEKDAIQLMKFSSIYNELEHAVDLCEDLMNVIEGIVLKQA
jgi:predicted phosphate transport protein (TIGR00153 family)